MLKLLLLASIALLASTDDRPKVIASAASQAAFYKYLEETCQNLKEEDILTSYLDWELHTFVTSLRIQLLPETEDGDLTAFVKSPLSKYIPASPLLGMNDPAKCSKQKRNKTMNADKLVIKTAFQDFIIDFWTGSYPDIYRSLFTSRDDSEPP